MRHTTCRACTFLLAAWLGTATADEAAPDGTDAGADAAGTTQASAAADALVHTRARPLYRNPPSYPASALASRLEGWFVVSYVVLEDGSTTDPVVESSSGVRDLERSAIRAVRNWRFEPATRNGQPVQQCDARTRLVFQLDLPGHQRGVTRSFRSEWERIHRLMDQGKTSEALERADGLAQRRSLNLYETARAAQLRATLHYRLDNTHQALASIRNAVWGASLLGDREVERSMLEAQLALELQLGEYRRATETAKTLLEEHGGDVSDERLEAVVSELLELQYGRTYVSVSGYIGDWTALDEQQPFWTHTLLRHRFGLEDIEGEVRALDIRCDTQRVLIEFEPNVAWNTQEDWGSCDVHVHGTPGTRFKLVEYPVAAAEAAGR